MFTWICPQCGHEVPPSYSECPACAERQQQAQAPAKPVEAAPPLPPPPPPQAPAPPQAAAPQYVQPQYPPQPPAQPIAPPPPPAVAPPVAPPAVQMPPQAPVYAQPQAPQYMPPPPQQQTYTIGEQKKGIPAWMVGVLTLAVLGGGLIALYMYVGGRSNNAQAPVAAQKAPEAAGKSHPYKKYLEVAGIRLMEGEGQKPVVRYTVINHSGADFTGLELNIVLTPTTGGNAIAVIDAKVGSVAANSVKDMESALNTPLKVYELPDWQFVKVSVEITAPN